MRKQNPSKIEIKIRESNLVKENLRHMDAYDGATIEQQIEILICHRIIYQNIRVSPIV